MKKDSIIKDYKNLPISGIFNMKEKSNMLCSKMMDIEDEIRISYNITASDVSESKIGLTGLTPLELIENTNNIIKTNSLHKISNSYVKQEAIKSIHLDKSQTQMEINNLSKWIFEFDSKYLLREYLYNEIYTLNPQSPFKLIPNDIIGGNKINLLCYDYINKNVLDRYRLKEFILWTSYVKLKDNVVPGTGTDPILNPLIKILYQTPIFSIHAIPGTSTNITVLDKSKETIAIKAYNDGLYEISYKQRHSSQSDTFLWYYDVIYEKI